jgi:glycosyltransferase involved in cell wall biosynthesis
MFSDRLHWLGTVEDLRPWYRAAWVLILASESESFGRVLVEAMGSGTPVIATRVGGIPEIVRNGQEGLLFSPGSSEQLANAIKKLLEEESLRMRLAQAAFRRADSFGLELHIRNMLKVFNEVCGYA